MQEEAAYAGSARGFRWNFGIHCSVVTLWWIGSMAIEFEMCCFGLVKMVGNIGELGLSLEARRQ